MGGHDPGELLARLEHRRVVVCVGSGGVGKTTISAALALGLAMRGHKVAVVTIDPARRLAAALGLHELAGTPRRIEPELLAAHGIAPSGELWAMMLDAKRTLDEIVTRLERDEERLQAILENPVYSELSTAVAGSHELSAIAKLYELHEEHAFDTIVLDTPPSRNAVDFLNAPTRLLGFLEGRALQVFLAPGGLTARLFGQGTGIAFSIFARVTGIDLFAELSRFFRSLSGVIEGFATQTREVAALLRDESTAFAIVTSPEPGPAREAVFLARQLQRARMHRAALIVNRVNLESLHGRAPEALASALAGELGQRLARRVAANLADFDLLARRDATTVADVTRELDEAHPVQVPQLDEDVQDLAGLQRVAEYLL
ncbi:MAG TPA: ArsA-related P-loop ATPase [Solirubrobacteraceae bacterium]|nr:ArsA-related P-loop ATPase [Solirubrobacteraceae bacterium]